MDDDNSDDRFDGSFAVEFARSLICGGIHILRAFLEQNSGFPSVRIPSRFLVNGSLPFA